MKWIPARDISTAILTKHYNQELLSKEIMDNPCNNGYILSDPSNTDEVVHLLQLVMG